MKRTLFISAFSILLFFSCNVFALENKTSRKNPLYISELGKIGRDVKFLKRRKQGINLSTFDYGGDFKIAYSSSNNVKHAYDPYIEKSISDAGLNVINLRHYLFLSLNDWIFVQGTYEMYYNYWQDGFVTIGNFNKLPYYATLGRQYVSFGNFTKFSSTTNPLTKILFRINANAVTIGRDRNNLNTTISLYEAQDYTLGFATQASYKFKMNKSFSGRIGMGFASDMLNVTNAFKYIHSDNNNKRLPTIDIFAELNLGKFRFKLEYDYVFNKVQNKKYLSAFDFESRYSFKTFDKASSINFSYSAAFNAEKLFADKTYSIIKLPKQQWTLAYKITPFAKTYLAFEYTLANTNSDRYYGVFDTSIVVKF